MRLPGLKTELCHCLIAGEKLARQREACLLLPPSDHGLEMHLGTEPPSFPQSCLGSGVRLRPGYKAVELEQGVGALAAVEVVVAVAA